VEDRFLKEFYGEFLELNREYNEAVAKGKYDEAIDLGIKAMNLLLDVVRKRILESLTSQTAIEIVSDIINYYEKGLAYVEGLREASRKVPLLYAYEAKERALETLARDIRELFSFALGALVMLAEISNLARLSNEN